MITADAIQKKDFTRGVRGYKEDEVDQFLDLIAADVDTMLRENVALRDRVKTLLQEAERYRGSEVAILETLEAAKSLMTDISVSAEKRAEIVLKNAELDAARIKRDARDSVEHMTEEAVALSRRWELFSARFRNLLETELDRFGSFSAGLMLGETPSGNTGDVRGVREDRSSHVNPMASVNSEKTFKISKQL